jgi:hypothetical protein
MAWSALRLDFGSIQNVEANDEPLRRVIFAHSRKASVMLGSAMLEFELDGMPRSRLTTS